MALERKHLPGGIYVDGRTLAYIAWGTDAHSVEDRVDAYLTVMRKQWACGDWDGLRSALIREVRAIDPLEKAA